MPVPGAWQAAGSFGRSAREPGQGLIAAAISVAVRAIGFLAAYHAPCLQPYALISEKAVQRELYGPSATIPKP